MVEKALHENISFMWISGMQRPDFKTLNNFRLRLGGDIKKTFKEIVKFGMECGVIKGKDIFIDHTKIEANANQYKVIWRKNVDRQLENIEKELEQLFFEIDNLNNEEDQVYGNESIVELQKILTNEQLDSLVERVNERMKSGEMEKEEGRNTKKKLRRAKELNDRRVVYKRKKEILGNRNSYSKTDIDAPAMKVKNSDDIKPSYNEGIATENRFVIDFVVSQNAADNTSFKELTEGTIANLEKVPDNVSADSAYGNRENYEYLEEKGINNYVKYGAFQLDEKKEKRNIKEGKNEELPIREGFVYDAENDSFICRNNCILSFQNEQEEIRKTGYKEKVDIYSANESDCSGCPLREECTKGKCRTLTVSWKFEEQKAQVRENMKSEKGKEMRCRRGHEVETVFGDMKMNHKRKRYILRGKWKVELEAGLFYMTSNIKRMYFYIMGQLCPDDIKGVFITS